MPPLRYTVCFIYRHQRNLLSAQKGEKEEWEIVYKQGAEIAKEEGFEEVSKLFTGILEIEKRHSYRFGMLADEIKNNSVFHKEELTQWLCLKCGHVQISQCAPELCPVCSHPQAYFEVFNFT